MQGMRPVLEKEELSRHCDFRMYNLSVQRCTISTEFLLALKTVRS